MPKKVNLCPVSVLTAGITGLIFALVFGLPLYIYCALWFGWIFPTQGPTMDLGILLVVLFLFLAVLAFLCFGFWRVGLFTAKKTGDMNIGTIAGLWMSMVAIGMLWLVRIVGTQLGTPMSRVPGNAVRGQALFGSIYFFAPFIIFFAGFLLGLMAGMIGANRADLPPEEV
ncbi:hypothetical protein [Dictyobacter kobayashii]|uniref:Uncharacterized protein n=1 Tax=Dictyobacter kobayashii TaxID=2014872 RepID=A0A402AV94_9CHLR|nr:hypothetical protein [Dictyobacter kobayashii]GCE23060.1 hypothetical protein KDK_68600 [Dictyobacter kobayashii]